MPIVYFDTAYAIKLHDDIVEKTGGATGILNIGLLISVIEHMKNDFYYPEFEDKLTHLFYSVNKNHSFNDGNKRSSIALSAYFLELNNLSFRVESFICEMENIAVDVADNKIDKELLHEIISSIIFQEDYDEALKIKIIHAKGGL